MNKGLKIQQLKEMCEANPFEYHVSEDEYKEVLNNHKGIDYWGEACLFVDKLGFGVEYNLCIDDCSGDNYSGIYLTEQDKEDGEIIYTDHSNSIHYEVNLADEDRKEKLEEAMWQALVELMLEKKIDKARTIICRMNEPTEWMKGNIFSCQIDFNNPNVVGDEDETSFDLDCSNAGWREELLQLWIHFCEENNFEIDSITDAWSTICNDNIGFREYAVEVYTEEEFVFQIAIFHTLDEARKFIGSSNSKKYLKETGQYFVVTCIEYDRYENEIDHYEIYKV